MHQVSFLDDLSTLSDSDDQHYPFLGFFCCLTTLHPMISLAFQIFCVQLRLACVLEKSSLCCAICVHTISSCWNGAPHLNPGVQALREGSLSLLHHLP